MKEQVQIPQKPLCLRKRDAELRIGNAINSAATVNNLSFAELEDILYKYFVECRNGAEKERKDAEISYNRQVAEYQRNKEKEKEKEVADHGGDHCTSDA